MSRPAGWSALHDAALAALTPAWETSAGLRARCPTLPPGHVVLDDLVTWGLAEVRREPLTVGGVAAGERTTFRRAAS